MAEYFMLDPNHGHVDNHEEDADKKFAKMHFDIFMSYSDTHSGLVKHQILPELESLGVKVCVPDRDIPPNLPEVPAVFKAIKNSDRFIIILSSEYLKEMKTEVRKIAKIARARDGDRSLLVIKVDDCQVKPWMKRFEVHDSTTCLPKEDLRRWVNLCIIPNTNPSGTEFGRHVCPEKVPSEDGMCIIPNTKRKWYYYIVIVLLLILLLFIIWSALQPHPSKEKQMATVRFLTYKIDGLQQESRRKSVWVCGVPSAVNETVDQLEKKVIEIFKSTGADVNVTDIAVVHRAGKEVRGGRSILAVFVSLRKKNEVMSKKKSLKEKPGYERIYINDYLTPLRLGLLLMIRGYGYAAWTKDGIVRCVNRTSLELPPADRPKPLIIESPDDLFKLGVTDIDYAALGLGNLSEIDVAAALDELAKSDYRRCDC